MKTRDVLFNWAMTFMTAVLIFYTTLHFRLSAEGRLGLVALTTANVKASPEFIPALGLGIMCNALACLVASVRQRIRRKESP